MERTYRPTYPCLASVRATSQTDEQLDERCAKLLGCLFPVSSEQDACIRFLKEEHYLPEDTALTDPSENTPVSGLFTRFCTQEADTVFANTGIDPCRICPRNHRNININFSKEELVFAHILRYPTSFGEKFKKFRYAYFRSSILFVSMENELGGARAAMVPFFSDIYKLLDSAKREKPDLFKTEGDCVHTILALESRLTGYFSKIHFPFSYEEIHSVLLGMANRYNTPPYRLGSDGEYMELIDSLARSYREGMKNGKRSGDPDLWNGYAPLRGCCCPEVPGLMLLDWRIIPWGTSKDSSIPESAMDDYGKILRLVNTAKLVCANEDPDSAVSFKAVSDVLEGAGEAVKDNAGESANGLRKSDFGASASPEGPSGASGEHTDSDAAADGEQLSLFDFSGPDLSVSDSFFEVKKSESETPVPCTEPPDASPDTPSERLPETIPDNGAVTDTERALTGLSSVPAASAASPEVSAHHPEPFAEPDAGDPAESSAYTQTPHTVHDSANPFGAVPDPFAPAPDIGVSAVAAPSPDTSVPSSAAGDPPADRNAPEQSSVESAGAGDTRNAPQGVLLLPVSPLRDSLGALMIDHEMANCLFPQLDAEADILHFIQHLLTYEDWYAAEYAFSGTSHGIALLGGGGMRTAFIPEDALSTLVLKKLFSHESPVAVYTQTLPYIMHRMMKAGFRKIRHTESLTSLFFAGSRWSLHSSYPDMELLKPFLSSRILFDGSAAIELLLNYQNVYLSQKRRIGADGAFMRKEAAVFRNYELVSGTMKDPLRLPHCYWYPADTDPDDPASDDLFRSYSDDGTFFQIRVMSLQMQGMDVLENTRFRFMMGLIARLLRETSHVVSFDLVRFTPSQIVLYLPEKRKNVLTSFEQAVGDCAIYVKRDLYLDAPRIVLSTLRAERIRKNTQPECLPAAAHTKEEECSDD